MLAKELIVVEESLVESIGVGINHELEGALNWFLV